LTRHERGPGISRRHCCGRSVRALFPASRRHHLRFPLEEEEEEEEEGFIRYQKPHESDGTMPAPLEQVKPSFSSSAAAPLAV